MSMPVALFGKSEQIVELILMDSKIMTSKTEL